MQICLSLTKIIGNLGKDGGNIASRSTRMADKNGGQDAMSVKFYFYAGDRLLFLLFSCVDSVLKNVDCLFW